MHGPVDIKYEFQLALKYGWKKDFCCNDVCSLPDICKNFSFFKGKIFLENASISSYM